MSIGLGAHTSGYIPVRKLDSDRDTLSISQRATAISVHQPLQVANAKMMEGFIEELPPIYTKRQKKHTTILTIDLVRN